MRLAKLVRRETCAAVAEEWEVGPHVVLGQGEARGGGRKKAAILSDICESLIGAVFLDAGFEAARALVEANWQGRMSADQSPERDAKTAVQEWAQGAALPAPRYSEVSRSGPAHLPVFVMQVELDGFRARARRSELEARRRTGGGAGLPRPLGKPMSETRCGFVALIGAPNAGKSTLVNALVGSKVSIVSRKAQTTRAAVRGVVVEGDAQIVFVDTPGLFQPKRRLDRAMNAAAWGAAADADVNALLIDARAEIGAAGKGEVSAAQRGDRNHFYRAERQAPGLAFSSSTRSISSSVRSCSRVADAAQRRAAVSRDFHGQRRERRWRRSVEARLSAR